MPCRCNLDERFAATLPITITFWTPRQCQREHYLPVAGESIGATLQAPYDPGHSGPRCNQAGVRAFALIRPIQLRSCRERAPGRYGEGCNV